MRAKALPWTEMARWPAVGVILGSSLPRDHLDYLYCGILVSIAVCSSLPFVFACQQWQSIVDSSVDFFIFQAELPEYSLGMATAATMNPNPSLPAELKKQHLPPKSYLDAREENLDPHSDSRSWNDQLAPELYAGEGEDATLRSPSRNVHKKSASLRVNGFSKDNKGPSVMVEKYEDKDGEELVSIRNTLDGQKSKTRRNSELVSGRRAGAGWEQSQ